MLKRSIKLYLYLEHVLLDTFSLQNFLCKAILVACLKNHKEINNVYSILECNKEALDSFGDGNCPYASSYRPKLDVTYEIYEDLTNRFQ